VPQAGHRIQGIEKAAACRFTRAVNHRAADGMQDIPPGDPELLAKMLFSCDNPPGTSDISGSQDALGIVLPGLNRLDYGGNYWPERITRIDNEDILQWLESHLFLVTLGPRTGNYTVVSNKKVDEAGAKQLARAAEHCWDAILSKDLNGFGKHFRKSFEAQVNMFPNMADDNIFKAIDRYRDSALGWKLSGAGGGNYLVPFLLVTSLFFLWGFAHSILDVLNKHFQEIQGVSKAQSGLVQAAVYGGYFFMAIPAGIFMKRFGYKKGILLGLLLYACGAFLFYPAIHIQAFWAFLFFITKLPDIDEAALQQSGKSGDESEGFQANDRLLFRHPHFIFAVVAQFFYVAAQTGINSFFINYVTDIFHQSSSGHFTGAHMLQRLTDLVGRMNPGITEYESLLNTTAGLMLSFSFGLFMAGRFLGSLLLTWMKPSRLLLIYSLISMALTGLVITGAGMAGIVSLSLIYLFMSVMFPTIFALGLKSLRSHTRRASSFIVMAIVGGAVFTPIMGLIADHSSMQTGFVVPLVCFAVVLAFAWFSNKPNNRTTGY
jgi:FHS family L-fucose permease-like MFS transporter